MASELRVRANGIGGKCEDNPLTAAATTLTSAGLAAVPVIGTTQHLAVVLDPDGIDGAPEIVWITAHTAAATTATILRAQEGTTARQHLRDTDWIHGATITDWVDRTEVVNTVAASGAAQTIPAVTLSTISHITLTANCTLTFPATVLGAKINLVLKQDGTGSRIVTWPASVKWAGAVAPTLSTGINKVDYLSFVCADGATWAGYVLGLDVR